MNIKRNDKEGVIKILKTLPIKEQKDFINNEFRKSLKLKDFFVLYIDNEPISFIEVYRLQIKDHYAIVITKEEFRGNTEVYEFRQFILSPLYK